MKLYSILNSYCRDKLSDTHNFIKDKLFSGVLLFFQAIFAKREWHSKKVFSCLTIVFYMTTTVIAQDVLTGKVVDWDKVKNTESTLPGANVYWIDGSAQTSTDTNGIFSIPMPSVLPAYLLVSYVGFQTDTIIIKKKTPIKVKLKYTVELKGVENTLPPSQAFEFL